VIAALIAAATVAVVGGSVNGGPAVSSTQAAVAGAPSQTGSKTPAGSGLRPSPGAAPGPVALDSPIEPTRGSIVFTDDFGDPNSGWATPSENTANTTFKYTADGYLVGSPGGSIEHNIFSPYRVGKQQLSMTLTATQADGPVGLGLGVSCRRGEGASVVFYSFLIVNDGSFAVERRDGDQFDSPVKMLREGRSSITPGVTPMTLIGMCATLADGSTTRLILFTDAGILADFTDKTTLSGPGWLGGLDMLSGKGPSFMTAKHWEERDLST
jgi:hypothetical protein